MCFMPKPKAPVISVTKPPAAAAAAPKPAPLPTPATHKPAVKAQEALEPREAPKPPERRSSNTSGSKSSAVVNKAGRAGTILAPMSSGGVNSSLGAATPKKTLLGA